MREIHRPIQFYPMNDGMDSLELGLKATSYFMNLEGFLIPEVFRVQRATPVPLILEKLL